MNIKQQSYLVLSAVVGVSALSWLSLNQPTDANDSGSEMSDTTVNTSTAAANTTTTESSATTNTTPPTSTETPSTATTEPTVSVYESSARYAVPRGSETIALKVVLNGDVISGLDITHSAGDRESALYQDRFDASIDGYVLDKPISEVSVSRVAGASLTTRAFMQALNDIEGSL